MRTQYEISKNDSGWKPISESEVKRILDHAEISMIWMRLYGDDVTTNTGDRVRQSGNHSTYYRS